MRKQKNKRGKITRADYAQTIIEKSLLKSGKPNAHYPGQKTIIHSLTGKP